MIRKIFFVFFLLAIAAATAFFVFPEKAAKFIPGMAPMQEEQAGPSKENIRLEFNSQADIDAWRHHSFKGESKYEVGEEEGVKFLKASSQDASSAIFKAVKVEMTKSPLLSWEWRALKFPGNKKNEKLAAKEDNDYAARIYAIFKGSGTFQQQEIIQYLWDDHFPEGEISESPFMKSVKVLVIQSGQAEGWVAEQRDLAADYKKLFGKEPAHPLMGIGIMSDSDNTGTSSAADLRNLRVEAEAGASVDVTAEDMNLIEEFAVGAKKFLDGIKHTSEGMLKTSSKVVTEPGKKIVELAKKVEEK